MPADARSPGGRRHDAAQDADERRLARAVRSEQREDLLFVNLELDVSERRQARGVTLRELGNRNDGRHGSSLERPGSLSTNAASARRQGWLSCAMASTLENRSNGGCRFI